MNSCRYICHMQETEFLLHGGDMRWLESDEHVPPKLLVLRELNAILAHQPWLLKREHLQRLIHPTSILGQITAWSLSECVLAILVSLNFAFCYPFNNRYFSDIESFSFLGRVY